MDLRGDFQQPQTPTVGASDLLVPPRSVTYCCGSCGYALNLSSTDRYMTNIGSQYRKSIKKGSSLSYRWTKAASPRWRSSAVVPTSNRDMFGVFETEDQIVLPELSKLCRRWIRRRYPSPDTGSGNEEAAWKKYDIMIRSLQPSSSK